MNTETFRFVLNIFDAWCLRYRVRIQTWHKIVHTEYIILTQYSCLFSGFGKLCTPYRKFQSAWKITFQNRLCQKFSLETLVQSISQPHKISPLHFHNIREVVNYPNQSSSIRFDSVCIRLDSIRLNRIESNYSTNRFASGLCYTSLKRVYHCHYWEDFVVSLIYSEKPLDDLCYSYWEKHSKALSRSKDGFLLLEQSSLNTYRSLWQERRERVHCLRRSRRFVPHVDVLGKKLDWMTSHGTSDSIVAYDEEEFSCFAHFPESF